MATILPLRIPISLRYAGSRMPSTTVPFLISRSYSAMKTIPLLPLGEHSCVLESLIAEQPLSGLQSQRTETERPRVVFLAEENHFTFTMLIRLSWPQSSKQPPWSWQCLKRRSVSRCPAFTVGQHFAAARSPAVCRSGQLRRYKLATLPPRTFCFWLSPIVLIHVSINSCERGQGESVWG